MLQCVSRDSGRDLSTYVHMQCVAVCCSMLQCAAVRCNECILTHVVTLRRVCIYSVTHPLPRPEPPNFFVCSCVMFRPCMCICSVLSCVAACCSVLQCVVASLS